MGMKPGVKRWWPEVILFVFSLADVEKTLILQVVLRKSCSERAIGSVRFVDKKEECRCTIRKRLSCALVLDASNLASSKV